MAAGKRLATILLAGIGVILLASPVSAAEATVQADGCVQTIVNRNSRGITSVLVMNACRGATLFQVDAHIFNGASPFDLRNQNRRNLSFGQFFRFPTTGDFNPPKRAPSGSLTCGELWAPPGAPVGRPWGRDCIRM